MNDILFYDEKYFKPERYAEAWCMITTRLRHCLSRRAFSPERHDYGVVYFLIKDEDSATFAPIIDSHRNAGFNIVVQNRVLPYTGMSPSEIRGKLRIMRAFKPFDDIAIDEHLDKLLEEEKQRQERENEAISSPLGFDNGLEGLLTEAGEKNAQRVKQRGGKRR